MFSNYILYKVPYINETTANFYPFFSPIWLVPARKTQLLIYFFFNGDLFINRINSIPKLVQCRAAGATIFFCSLLPWGDLPGAFLLENLVATARTSSGVGGVWARARAAPSYRPEQQPNCSEFGIRTPSLL